MHALFFNFARKIAETTIKMNELCALFFAFSPIWDNFSPFSPNFPPNSYNFYCSLGNTNSEVIILETFHYADLSTRVTSEIKRLENQISNDIHKDIYLIAYEKNAQQKEARYD